MFSTERTVKLLQTGHRQSYIKVKKLRFENVDLSGYFQMRNFKNFTIKLYK